MLSYGFGDPIAGFANPHNETRRDTPYLTIGHTPWSFGGLATSSRGAFAFAPRGNRVSTTATYGTRTVGGRTLFLYLFLFTGVDPVHALGHGHSPVLGVVVAVVDLDWTFGWTCGAQKVALPHLRRPWSGQFGHHYGVENTAVCDAIVAVPGEGQGSFIAGSFTRNQKIERLSRDFFRCICHASY